MKLTEEQKREKQARENIKRLINRVSSEYSFKKWRNYHGYLHSMGHEVTGPDRELSRAELDELLEAYENEALTNLLPKSTATQEVFVKETAVSNGEPSTTVNKEVLQSISKTESVATSNDEKFTEKNNYGLSKSDKEKISLFWFQKKASAEILKGFLV